MTQSTTGQLGIAEVSARTGLTKDTLRWYEHEGLIPAVPRGSDGRRRYDEPTLRMIELLIRLRRTGMPVREMREFVRLVGVGSSTHGRRMALLEQHREEVQTRLRELLADLDAIEDKIGHYARLIEAGLDCAGQPMEPNLIMEQRRKQ
ncbi:MerR family transcriptional regulator [Naumannella huperziae]